MYAAFKECHWYLWCLPNLVRGRVIEESPKLLRRFILWEDALIDALQRAKKGYATSELTANSTQKRMNGSACICT